MIVEEGGIEEKEEEKKEWKITAVPAAVCTHGHYSVSSGGSLVMNGERETTKKPFVFRLKTHFPAFFSFFFRGGCVCAREGRTREGSGRKEEKRSE